MRRTPESPSEHAHHPYHCFWSQRSVAHSPADLLRKSVILDQLRHVWKEENGLCFKHTKEEIPVSYWTKP